VLSKIPQDKQVIYNQYSSMMDTEVTRLVNANQIDSLRFWQKPDHFTKLRFLQADSYDLAKAVARLSHTVVWRQQSGFDDFVSEPDLKLYARYRALRIRRAVGAFDKCGRPLIVERLGGFMSDMQYQRGLTLPQFALCYAYDLSFVFAEFRKQVEQGGKYSHRVAYIADLSGIRFGVSVRTVSLFKLLAAIVEGHFCEIAGPISLVNCPSFASYVYGLLKRFLDPHTTEMITLSSDSALPDLERLYGLEVVPQEYGGNLKYDIPALVPMDERFEQIYPTVGLHKGFPGMSG